MSAIVYPERRRPFSGVLAAIQWGIFSCVLVFLDATKNSSRTLTLTFHVCSMLLCYLVMVSTVFLWEGSQDRVIFDFNGPDVVGGVFTHYDLHRGISFAAVIVFGGGSYKLFVADWRQGTQMLFAQGLVLRAALVKRDEDEKRRSRQVAAAAEGV
jgi:hypothetical protein